MIEPPKIYIVEVTPELEKSLRNAQDVIDESVKKQSAKGGTVYDNLIDQLDLKVKEETDEVVTLEVERGTAQHIIWALMKTSNPTTIDDDLNIIWEAFRNAEEKTWSEEEKKVFRGTIMRELVPE